MSLHNPSLESQLHDLFISQGEISSPSCIADLVLQYESFYCVHLSNLEITVATRNAGESFVDSMIENEYDTPNDETESRVAYWESMRPNTVRRKHIESLVTA